MIALVLIFLTSASVFGCTDVDTSRHDHLPSVLLVVGEASDLTAGDGRIRDHLRTAWNVRVRVVSTSTSGMLDGVDLALVAPSAYRGDVTEVLRDAALPLLVLNDDAWPALGLAGGSGSTERHEEIDVTSMSFRGVDPGSRRLVSSPIVMRFPLDAAPGGRTLGMTADDLAHVVLFSVEADAPLTEGHAPARRVAFAIREGDLGLLLAPGWDLIDASIGWLLGWDVEHDRSALLVAGGDLDDLNASEIALRSRLWNQGFDVTVIDDDGLSASAGDAFDVVVMSKTVNSVSVGTALKATSAGVMFWEDNQQMLQMMATIDDDGEEGTFWHAGGDRVFVDPSAPATLRGSASGLIDLYMVRDEITFAPPQALTGDAIRVARFQDGADSRYAMYAYDVGGRLADASPAAGRRVFFGLYDDTFRHLTLDALALFDVQIAWLSKP